MPIYEPKGPAKEYAPLALNYYKGCGHACAYCYVPGFLGMISGKEVDRSGLGIVGNSKHTDVKKVEVFLAKLERVAKKYSGISDRVLLSFTSDPYQPWEKELQLTRNVLRILGAARVPVTILTKNPKFALERDFDLIKNYDTVLATTIVWVDDKKRKEWEPNTCTIQERVEALKVCQKESISTWVSIEPIIDKSEVQPLIKLLSGSTGLLKIGVVDPRWNSTEHAAVDWVELLSGVLKLLHQERQSYYIKDGLWKYATEEIREIYPKEKKLWC